MNVIKVNGSIFTVVGIGILVACFFIYQNTRKFIDIAEEVGGVVVKLEQRESTSTSTTGRTTTSYVYAPVVEFTTLEGQEVTFTSSVASNPPSYHEGDKLTVLYNPQNTQEAEIKSFMSLWFGVLITGILGPIFTVIGLALLIVPGMKAR